MWRSGADSNGSKSGSVEEYCEYSKDYSGSIKQGGITEKLSYTVPGWKYKICRRICNFSEKTASCNYYILVITDLHYWSVV